MTSVTFWEIVLSFLSEHLRKNSVKPPDPVVTLLGDLAFFFFFLLCSKSGQVLLQYLRESSHIIQKNLLREITSWQHTDSVFHVWQKQKPFLHYSSTYRGQRSFCKNVYNKLFPQNARISHLFLNWTGKQV